MPETEASCSAMHFACLLILLEMSVKTGVTSAPLGAKLWSSAPPQLFPCPLGHCPFSAGGSGGAPVHGPERPPGEKRHRAGSFQDLQFKHSKQASGSTHESSVKLPGSLSYSESCFHRSPWFILV